MYSSKKCLNGVSKTQTIIMKKFCLSFTLCLLSLSLWAYDVEVDGIYYNIKTVDKTAEVTFGENKYSGDIIIPETIPLNNQTFIVTAIGRDAFGGSSTDNLFSVVIPNTVTDIGNAAFFYNDKLKKITIGTSVKNIGMQCFEHCTGLECVNILDLANWCQLNFENSYSNPLQYAHKLYLNGELIKELVIPNSVQTIGESAFYSCSELERVIIGESVTKISDFAFSGCTLLKDLVMGNNVNSIGYMSFAHCTELENVVIPNSVKSIGIYAFEYCKTLNNIIIGNTVQKIDKYAFYGCTALNTITSFNENPPVVLEGAFSKINKLTTNIYVPEASVEKYKSSSGWNDFWNIIAIGGEGGGDVPELLVCSTPTLNISENKLYATSATNDSKCEISVTSKDFCSRTNEFELDGVYNISCFAHASGFQNSKTVTATLVWVNPTLQDNETTNVLSMNTKKAVLLKSNANSISISGTENGDLVKLYSIDGQLQDTVVANGADTSIGNGLTAGNIYLVKIGEKSIKYKF